MLKRRLIKLIENDHSLTWNSTNNSPIYFNKLTVLFNAFMSYLCVFKWNKQSEITYSNNLAQALVQKVVLYVHILATCVVAAALKTRATNLPGGLITSSFYASVNIEFWLQPNTIGIPDSLCSLRTNDIMLIYSRYSHAQRNSLL